MNGFHFTPGIDWEYTLPLIGILVLLVLVVGVWIGRLTRRLPRPAPPPVPPTGDRTMLDKLAEQRGALISGCVRARGLLDDQLLIEVLDDALRHGGVHIVDPTGSRANPSEHRTAGTDPASAPNQDGVISRTLRPGFIDAGRVLRAADVVVYKWGN